MDRNPATVISILFHPLLMPSYLFWLIIEFVPSAMYPLRTDSLYEILGIIFLVSFVIPAISISALRWTNYISDLNLSERKDRLTPVFFIGCFYSIAAYMFYTKISVNHLVFYVFAIMTILVFTVLIITVFWKISIHGVGVGALLGIFMAILVGGAPVNYGAYVLAGVILLCGIVMYARLSLNTHTPSQVYIGTFLGLLVSFGGAFLLIY